MALTGAEELFSRDEVNSVNNESDPSSGKSKFPQITFLKR
jgi:hypothetical protein